MLVCRVVSDPEDHKPSVVISNTNGKTELTGILMVLMYFSYRQK